MRNDLVLVVFLLVVQASGLGKNVLLMIIDDLRPQLPAYGSDFMKTPAFNRLADEGTVFQRAYVQYALCGPSRNSFLSGRRPDTTKTWTFKNNFRQVGSNWTSLPQHFKENGYLAMGSGKVYHPGLPPNFDQPKSWTNMTFQADDCTSNPALNITCLNATDFCPNTNKKLIGYCAVDRTTLPPNQPMQDDVVLSTGLAMMQTAASTKQPFFLAIGFHKPHLPFMYPIELNETYPPTVDPPLQAAYPADMPLCSWHYGFNNTFDQPLVPEYASHFRRAYYSCVSYTDHNVGVVLDELDRLQMTEDTVTVIMGDHGWHLGEMNLWRKHSNFELATRVPLIIRTPWLPQSVGKKTPVIFEAVDLYPTLVELAGLSQPKDKLEGISQASILQDPPASGVGLKQYAFHQYAKAYVNDSKYGKVAWGRCEWCQADQIDVMGYSIRSDTWLYTEWAQWDKVNLKVLTWDNLVGVELYNHTDDHTKFVEKTAPTANLAKEPSLQGIVETLSAALHAQFTGN